MILEITDEQLEQVKELIVRMNIKYACSDFRVVEYRFQPSPIAIRALVVIGGKKGYSGKLIKEKFDITDYTKW